MRNVPLMIFAGFLALLLGGCRDNASLPEQATTGASPQIPEPNKSIIPTINIAPAEG